MINIKRKIEIEIEMEIAEDGGIGWARLADGQTLLAAARAWGESARPSLIKEYERATRSKLDEGLIRRWHSSFSGHSMEYLKIDKITRTLVVIKNGPKYYRMNGSEVGFKHSRFWLDEDDLKTLAARDGAKAGKKR